MAEEEHDLTPDLEEHEEGFKSDGYPTLRSLSNAIQVWSISVWAARRADGGPDAQPITVADVALSFMLPTELVAAAVEYHYWMFLDGDGPLETRTIEHEGE